MAGPIHFVGRCTQNELGTLRLRFRGGKWQLSNMRAAVHTVGSAPSFSSTSTSSASAASTSATPSHRKSLEPRKIKRFDVHYFIAQLNQVRYVIGGLSNTALL